MAKYGQMDSTIQDSAKGKIQQLIEKYNQVVNSNKLKGYTEEETKKGFIEPLFAALGWEISNKEEVTAEESQSSGRVDYGFYLEGRIKFYVEAKPLKADLHNEEYAKQAIRYSWNKGVDWAILTDFESIKIFYCQDPTQSLFSKLVFEVKFDEYIDRFDQLWLLSKDSFKANELELYAQKHGKKMQKISVGDQLYKHLNECRQMLIEKLGTWNGIKDQKLLDEGVQKLIDRLIFIRVAEDREIERPTLIPLLRAWESNKNGKGLYESMIGKFRELDEIYNSNLFTEHPFEKWNESPGVTEKVIETFQGKAGYYEYDFKIMPADVLGAVYENYLGHRLAASKKGVVLDKDAKKRKEQGIYYTPAFIVDYIVKNALKPVLDKCKSIDDLKKIKVLDPACGSGSFLIKALEVINDKYKEFGNKGDEYTKITILLENIYGVDLDEQAIEIARLNLLLSALETRMKLPKLDKNIKNGNSLISGSDEELEKYFGKNFRDKKPFNWEEEFPEVFKQGGFDVIIGNPPYITSRSEGFSKQEKEYFFDNYVTLKDKPNTYILFIEKGINLLRRDGFLGFIVPNSWLGIESAQKLRKFILEKTSILNLVNTYGLSFGSAQVETLLFILQNKPSNEGHNSVIANIYADNFQVNDTRLVKQSRWNYQQTIDLISSDTDHDFIDRIVSSSVQLSDLADCKSGLQAYEKGKGEPKQTEEDVKNRIYDATSRINESTYKYLEGKDISRYSLKWGGGWLQYGSFLSQPRTLEIFSKHRILIREITNKLPFSLHAMFVDETYLNNKSILNVILKDQYQKNSLVILAILNSRLMSFFYSRKAVKSNRTLFPKLVIKDVRELPIPKDIQNASILSTYTEKMIKLHRELMGTSENSNQWYSIKSEIEKTDKKIDEEVYKLYGLTPEEIEIVAGK